MLRNSLSLPARACLGALLFLVPALMVRATEPFRLDRVAVVRFTDVGNDKVWMQQAVLETNGRLSPRAGREIARPPNAGPWIFDRNLIETTTWLGYRRLGTQATEGFLILEGAVKVPIDGIDYFYVGPNPDAPKGTGRMINISTRARLAATNDVVIAGFIVDDYERIVLVRAVGPGLRDFGVNDAAPDPILSVKRGEETIYTNDNWSVDPHADDMARAAARTGAFSLQAGSKDAACLLRIAPGAYTVHVEVNPANPVAGSVIVEVYSVPDDGSVDF